MPGADSCSRVLKFAVPSPITCVPPPSTTLPAGHVATSRANPVAGRVIAFDIALTYAPSALAGPDAVMICGLLETSSVVTSSVFTPSPSCHDTVAIPSGPTVRAGQEFPAVQLAVLTVPPPLVTLKVTDCPTTGEISSTSEIPWVWLFCSFTDACTVEPAGAMAPLPEFTDMLAGRTKPNRLNSFVLPPAPRSTAYNARGWMIRPIVCATADQPAFAMSPRRPDRNAAPIDGGVGPKPSQLRNGASRSLSSGTAGAKPPSTSSLRYSSNG